MKPFDVFCVVVFLSIMAFVAGVLYGQNHPPHHYQQFGMGPLVIDAVTGEICDSYPTPLTAVYPACPNVRDINGKKVK